MTGIYHDDVVINDNINRITFGCHHLYVLNHPREMKSLPATNKPAAITYLQGIEDIAISAGYTTGRSIVYHISLILLLFYVRI